METPTFDPFAKEALELMGAKDFEELHTKYLAERSRLRRSSQWDPVSNMLINRIASLLKDMELDRTMMSHALQFWRLSILWHWNLDAAAWALRNQNPKLAERYATAALDRQRALLKIDAHSPNIAIKHRKKTHHHKRAA